MKSGRKKLHFSFIVLFIALACSACGRLSQKTATAAFLNENPTFTILDSATGEGWDGVAYHHFIYKKPNDEQVYKEMWCFEQQSDGNWKVTSSSAE